MQQLNDTFPIERKRPDFLNALCILSFIGCGISLITGLFGLKNLFLSVEELTASMEMIEQSYPEAYDKAIAALQYKDINAIAGIITPLLSLFGVIQMWRLKKEGFYIYLMGEIIPYILIFSTTGIDSFTLMGGAIPNFESVIHAILISIVLFDIAFIVLYAINLKHMD